MKIAIVSPHFNAGNVPNEFSLAKGLTEMGTDVTIFTSRSPGKRSEFIPKKILEKGILEEKKFGFNVKRLDCLFDWRGENPLMLSLESELLKGSFDLIQSTDYYRFITLQSLKVSNKTGKPFVFTAHRYISPTDFISKQFLSFSNNFFQKKVLNQTKKIIAVSKPAKKYILNRFNFPPEKIPIITQGIDQKIFHSKKKPGKNKILTIGRLIPLKGQKFLIKACNILEKQGVDFSLTIKGRGPEYKNLEKLIKKFGLEKKVFIDTKFSWPNDIPKTLNSFDLFAMPSLIDPIGLSCLEAMSCSLPVVGTNVGGLKEVIENKKNGFLVEPANETQLAKKIGVLLEDKELRLKLGKNARKTIGKKFSYKEKAKNHLKVYKNLLRHTF